MPKHPRRHRWRERRAAWGDRWATDRAWRYATSLLGAAALLVGIGSCGLVGLLVGPRVAPGLFPLDQVIHTNGVGQATDFPVMVARAQPTAANLTPLPVATLAFGAPTAVVMPSPTPSTTPSPTPGAPPTATPLPVVCSPSQGQPVLTGRTVQDGTLPTPLAGGCPAILVISAPAQPDAPISGTLTFGTINPLGCTITLTGTTDATGNARLSFTVPGTDCFRGSITTNGQLTVGGDATGNTSFPADG
jgi:hypothetical protein